MDEEFPVEPTNFLHIEAIDETELAKVADSKNFTLFRLISPKPEATPNAVAYAVTYLSATAFLGYIIVGENVLARFVPFPCFQGSIVEFLESLPTYAERYDDWKKHLHDHMMSNLMRGGKTDGK